MNYFGRYGLDFDPFLKENSKSFSLELNSYNETKIRLNNLLKLKGFSVITGGPGIGKTTTVRRWTEELSTSLYKVIYTPLSTLTVNEFYRNLAVEMGLPPETKKSSNFNNIQNEINRYSIEKKITPIIIIDEANQISNGVLSDLKILFNFDMDSSDRAIVILIGLPTLTSIINLSANEAIKQRISVNYNLPALSKEDSKNYIMQRIQHAKGTSTILEESAYDAIANAANGIPRVINKLYSQSLIIANALNRPIVDSEVVLHAIDEIAL